MFERDGIIYADDQVPVLKILNVIPKDNYQLIMSFSTGEVKVFDAKTLIGKGNVFDKLVDIDYFMQAHVDFGTVVWDETLDIAPEYLYEYATNMEI